MKLGKYSTYLVCHGEIDKVKDFLNQFFKEIQNQYTSEDWVSFEVPNQYFKISLMRGEKEELTQNLNLELGVGSLDNLKEFAEKYSCDIESFLSTESEQDYTYYYIEIPGPKSICNVTVSYVEDIK